MERTVIERRRRNAARVALYGSMVILLAALFGGLHLSRAPLVGGKDQFWTDTDYATHPTVDLLRRYVQIDTTVTTGSEAAGAEFLAAQLAEVGIEAHIERLGETEANLWAILEGERPEALVLHSHIDVAPIADPDAWEVPPFEGYLDRAWLYGRGVFDMKSVAIAQLEAIKSLAASGKKPRFSVILLATGSEEVGSELGTRWVLARHPELVKRFWAVLTEGGIVEPLNRESIAYWGIEVAQKQYAHGEICAPTREDLEAVRAAATAWGMESRHVRLTPEVGQMLEAYAPSRPGERSRDVLSEIRRTLEDPAEFRKIPRYIRAMLRNELGFFDIEESPGGGYRLPTTLLLLPGAEPQPALDELLPGWLTHGLSVSFGPPLGAGHGSPTAHPVFQATVATIRERYPDTRVGPYFLAFSATDARFFRAAGIPAYGFSPFPVFPTDTYRVDTINERMDMPSFVEGVETYTDLVARLAG